MLLGLDVAGRVLWDAGRSRKVMRTALRLRWTAQHPAARLSPQQLARMGTTVFKSNYHNWRPNRYPAADLLKATALMQSNQSLVTCLQETQFVIDQGGQPATTGEWCNSS